MTRRRRLPFPYNPAITQRWHRALRLLRLARYAPACRSRLRRKKGDDT